MGEWRDRAPTQVFLAWFSNGKWFKSSKKVISGNV